MDARIAKAEELVLAGMKGRGILAARLLAMGLASKWPEEESYQDRWWSLYYGVSPLKGSTLVESLGALLEEHEESYTAEDLAKDALWLIGEHAEPEDRPRL